MNVSKQQPQKGFTLIEMIVSLGVFSVVVTIAVGALLILISSNRQLQNEQSVLSNLSFAIDSMTREMRTGSHYYCDSRSNLGGLFTSNIDNLDTPPTTFATADCHDGRSNPGHDVQGVAFVEGGDSITGATNSRILYFFQRDNNPRVQGLYRKIGNNTAEKIVSDGIYISDAEFFVSGAAPLDATTGADSDQASVSIYIAAAATSTPGAKIHSIQTTVVQRTLDI